MKLWTSLFRHQRTLSKHTYQHGQSLVEFALTLPIMLLLLLGVLDLGRLYFAYITVVNASREGARLGAAYPPINATRISNIQNKAMNEAQGSMITLTMANIDAPVCPSGCSSGNVIQVTVHYNFYLLTGYILGGGIIPLRSTAEFQIFGQ